MLDPLFYCTADSLTPLDGIWIRWDPARWTVGKVDLRIAVVCSVDSGTSYPRPTVSCVCVSVYPGTPEPRASI